MNPAGLDMARALRRLRTAVPHRWCGVLAGCVVLVGSSSWAFTPPGGQPYGPRPAPPSTPPLVLNRERVVERQEGERFRVMGPDVRPVPEPRPQPPGPSAALTGPSTEVPTPAPGPRPAINGPSTPVPQPAPTARASALRSLLDRSFVDVVAVGGAGGYYCTGVLVEPRLVLTARHCVPATRVLFGSSISDASAAVMEVESVRAHPNPTIDAALLVLRSPAAQPARPRRRLGDDSAPIGVVRLVGFGATDIDGRRGFGIKREIDAPISGWGCDRFRADRAACQVGRELVLPRSGRDTCDGDSGGPVFEYRPADPVSSWRLVAITSRPVPGSVTRCGAGGIYVRVDPLSPWIDEQAARQSGIADHLPQRGKEQRP